MSDAGERIARVEVRADAIEHEQAGLEAKVDSIAKDIHDIKAQLSNWRGFFSGVVFAISALAGLIGAGATALYHKLSG